MPLSRQLINNILNYNLGSRAYSPAHPADVYVGLSTTEVTDISNISASVTAMSYLLKVVTLTATNIFKEGDSIIVAGVDAGFTTTNIDGTWVCDAGTNSTTIVFTVDTQPTGTTPQTISVGTVTGDIIVEPSGGDAYARVSYSNDASPQQWTVSTNGELENTTAVTFPESTASWGTALNVFIADAASAGNILWYYTLSPSINIQANTVISFAAGDIVGSLT